MTWYGADNELAQRETVLREAPQRRETVFLRFAAEDPRFEGAESIRVESIQSVICCPLLLAALSAWVNHVYYGLQHESTRYNAKAVTVLLDKVLASLAPVIC